MCRSRLLTTTSACLRAESGRPVRNTDFQTRDPWILAVSGDTNASSYLQHTVFAHDHRPVDHEFPPIVQGDQEVRQARGSRTVQDFAVPGENATVTGAGHHALLRLPSRD